MLAGINSGKVFTYGETSKMHENTCGIVTLVNLMLRRLDKFNGHVSAKCVGNRSCGSGNRAFLICHMTSCDYVIKDHITLRLEAPHPESALVQVLKVIGIVEVEVKRF